MLVIDKFLRGEAENPKTVLAPDIEALRLQDSLKSLNQKHTFVPGMIVRQKPQAKFYKGFGDNDMAIVLEVLETPVFSSDGDKDAGSPFFRQPCDLIIGSIEGPPEDFCLYHVDSRRFEPHPDFQDLDQ